MKYGQVPIHWLQMIYKLCLWISHYNDVLQGILKNYLVYFLLRSSKSHNIAIKIECWKYINIQIYSTDFDLNLKIDWEIFK